MTTRHELILEMIVSPASHYTRMLPTCREAVAAALSELASLRAEVARLRAAGDELARASSQSRGIPSQIADFDAALTEWRAIRKGTKS